MKKIILISCVIISLLFAECKTIVPCENLNENVVIYNKPRKSYPSYVKSFDVNLKSNIKLTKEIENFALDASTKGNVTALRDKLNQTNITYENILKSAFFAYSQSVCDTIVRRQYFALLNKINEENTKLESLKKELTEFANKTNFGNPETMKLKNNINEYLQSSKF